MAGPGKQTPPPLADRSFFWTAAGLLAAVFLAWSNSFGVPFFFDGITDIAQNPSIRSFDPLWGPLFAPGDTGLSGRPLANFSLAVNFALGGENPGGYHAVNLLLHAATALALFCVLREALGLPALKNRFGRTAASTSAAVALVWALHPLATATVTPVFRRPELLACCAASWAVLFSVRGFSRPGRAWQWLPAAFLFAAALSKPTAAVAPLVILAWDSALVSGTPVRALKRAPALYAGGFIAACLAVALSLSSPVTRAGIADAAGPFTYFLNQSESLFLYLAQVLFPSALCLDRYAPPKSLGPLILPLAGALAFLAFCLWAVIRRKPWSVALVWFLLFLAPTSSLVPQPALAADHRAYLASAGIMALVLVLLRGLLSGKKHRDLLNGIFLCLVAALVLVLGAGTYLRNTLYLDELALWEDTVKKAPQNPRAHMNLGVALDEAGNKAEALRHLETALAQAPDNAMVRYNLGNTLVSMGRVREAARHYEKAVLLDPGFISARFNLGQALMQSGDFRAAAVQLETILQIRPDVLAVRVRLAQCLEALGDREGAQREMAKVRSFPPGDTENLPPYRERGLAP